MARPSAMRSLPAGALGSPRAPLNPGTITHDPPTRGLPPTVRLLAAATGDCLPGGPVAQPGWSPGLGTMRAWTSETVNRPERWTVIGIEPARPAPAQSTVTWAVAVIV